MYSSFLPHSPSLCQSIRASTPPLPTSSLYLNVFPLTLHSSIRREGLKSMVTVQSKVNWQTLPALLGWRELVWRKTGSGGKKITAEWRPFGMEKERPPLFTLSTCFYFFIGTPPSIPHTPSVKLTLPLILCVV